MFKKSVLLFSLVIVFVACKSSKVKNKPSEKSQEDVVKVTIDPKAENIIEYAAQFEGVKYKYGGTTKKGMDCSGLVMTSFNSEGITLPRTTNELSTFGNWIDLKDVKNGDLLFFATKKNSRKVNHIGLVTKVRTGQVEFIHSTTSKGVIRSNLSERYWYFAFVQARRVL